MAVSKGLGQFAKRAVFIADKVEENTELAIRRAAIKADQAAVLSTPVDTGRARGSWRVGIGSPIAVDIDPQVTGGDTTGSLSLEQARRIISSWKLNYGPIFIGNGVPYIVPLDEGSSAQAPNGMTRAAINAARAELRRAKLLKGL